MTQAILPGGTLGVLGSGQLGRMFALSARSLGYGVQTFSPDANSPMGQVADREWVAAYDDLDAVREFALSVDVVTFEFENVPAETAAVAAEIGPVRPSGAVLHIAQHRRREKEFLSRHGFPCAPFRLVTTLPQLEAALAEIGTPAILKPPGSATTAKGRLGSKSLPTPPMLGKNLAAQSAYWKASCNLSVKSRLSRFVPWTAALRVLAPSKTRTKTAF